MSILLRYCVHVVMLVATGVFSSGCATIFEGKSQQIVVNTNPTGADCGLYRQSLRIGTIQNAPGSTLIEKNKYDIWIVCAKAGYQQATYFNHSGVAGATVADVLGGIVTGGIAWGIDSASGADNKYDSPVNMTLVPNAPGQPEGPSALPATFTADKPAPGSVQGGTPDSGQSPTGDSHPRGSPGSVTAGARMASTSQPTASPRRELEAGVWVCGINNPSSKTNPYFTIEFAIAADQTITVATYANAAATIVTTDPLTFTAVNPRGERLTTFTLKADNSMLITGPSVSDPNARFRNAGTCAKS